MPFHKAEASKTMDHYTDMLNKVNEVGDLYWRANGEILNMMGQWIAQDAQLRDDFISGLSYIQSSPLSNTKRYKYIILYNLYKYYKLYFFSDIYKILA